VNPGVLWLNLGAIMDSRAKWTSASAIFLLVCCAATYVAFLSIGEDQSDQNDSPTLNLHSADRSLEFEPLYQSHQPGYALLAFGETAEATRWLVLDDDHAYFDRNGDRCLNQSDEKIPASNIQILGKNSPFSERREFVIGDVSVGDAQHHEMVVLQFRGPKGDLDSLPEEFRFLTECPNLGGNISLTMDGTKWSATPVFGKDVQDAPIIHFGGPLTVHVEEGFSSHRILRRDTELRLDLSLGAAGIGQNAFAFQDNTEIPQHIHPLVRASFANRDPSKPPVVQEYALSERC